MREEKKKIRKIWEKSENRGGMFKKIKTMIVWVKDWIKIGWNELRYVGCVDWFWVGVETHTLSAKTYCYNKEIEINPNNYTAYNNRGCAYFDLGDYTKAKENYDKVIELHPGDSMAYYNRGNVYTELQEHKKAIDDFTKAIETYPSYASAYFNRAMAYYKEEKKYEEAIKDLEEAMSIYLAHENSWVVGRCLQLIKEIKLLQRCLGQNCLTTTRIASLEFAS